MSRVFRLRGPSIVGTVAELPTVQVQGLVGLKGDSQLDPAPEQLKPGTFPLIVPPRRVYDVLIVRGLFGVGPKPPEKE